MNSFKKNEIEEIYGITDILATGCEMPADDFESIEDQVANCTKCPLHKGRTNTVFGEGNLNADLMFIGEGPGYDEDQQGRPFVGEAGKKLTDMISAMTLDRKDVYIANIVKCRPPGNRAPFEDESEACIPYLYKQIERVKPKVIVCLGAVPTQNLLKNKIPISKQRGKFTDYKGIKVMPTFHPAYFLRNPKMKRPVWEDLQMVMEILGLKR